MSRNSTRPPNFRIFIDAATLKVAPDVRHVEAVRHFRIFIDAATLKVHHVARSSESDLHFRIFIDAATLKEMLVIVAEANVQ